MGGTWEPYCDIFGEGDMEGEVTQRRLWNPRLALNEKKNILRHTKTMQIFNGS